MEGKNNDVLMCQGDAVTVQKTLIEAEFRWRLEYGAVQRPNRAMRDEVSQSRPGTRLELVRFVQIKVGKLGIRCVLVVSSP